MNRSFVAMAIVAALAIGALARPALTPSASASPTPASPYYESIAASMRTSGSAVIRVQPDRATIRFGIQTFADTPRAAHNANEAIVKRVLEAVRNEGVETRDIATDYLSIRPEYDYPMRGQRSLIGYWCENIVQVVLRDVTKLSPVLLAALDAGATTVGDLTFTTTRLRELRDEARTMALKAAREKADDLAAAAGLTVDRITSIDEDSSSYYDGYWAREGQWVNQSQNVMQEVSPAAAMEEIGDGEFSLGQIVVRAQVQLSTAIR